MDRKTKKAVLKVIKKYTGSTPGQKAGTNAVISGGLLGVLIGADLLLTGGIGTMAIVAGGTFAGLRTADITKQLLDAKAMQNAQNYYGQRYQASPPVIHTLTVMESRLRNSFLFASARDATPQEKEAFKTLVTDVEADAKTLSPAFKMVAGGDKFEFVVYTPWTSSENMTLRQAVDMLDGKPLPEPEKTREEIIKELKARVEALEKPTPELKKKKLG